MDASTPGVPTSSGDFIESLGNATPSAGLGIPLQALWWDAKGDWQRAHALVNDLNSPEAMAVHAYLHRKEGDAANADYWYRRAGSAFRRPSREAEWSALVEALLKARD